MDKKNIFKKIKFGFTLVELIVVIAIIGLLVTLSLIALSNARMASRDSKRMADIKQLQTALELFYDAQNRYPTNAEFQTGSLSYFNGNLGTTTYISIPTPPTPADGRCSDAQNAYVYNSSADGSTYTLKFCVAKPIADLAAGPLVGISGGILADCQPTCGSNNCGDNGCGGVCGTCTAPQTCAGGGVANQCGCTPNCSGKNCGDDGCGGVCGTCSGFNTCGGAGVPGHCGCAAETDTAFCSRIGTSCNRIDNCGQPRIVTGCGTVCGYSQHCGNDLCVANTLSTPSISGQPHSWRSITSSDDGSKLAAADYNNGIYTSANSGVTWTLAKSDYTAQSITSSADGTKLAAVSRNGIHTSANSGVTWAYPVSTSNYWYQIISSTDGSKLVAMVGGNYDTGYIYTSIDSGVTWVERQPTPSVMQNWQSITSSADGSKVTAVFPAVICRRCTPMTPPAYLSSDYGATWTPSVHLDDWWAVLASADGNTLLAGCDPTLKKSTDSGNNWTEYGSNQNMNLNILTASIDGSRLAGAHVGITAGYIYVSSDSGATWTQLTALGQRNWSSVKYSADGKALFATDMSSGGSIYMYR